MTSTRIEIPPLYCPIPYQRHPQWQQLERDALAWMTDYGFCEHPAARQQVVNTNTGEFLALAIPGTTEERLQVLTNLGYLLFVLDDERYTLGGSSSEQFGELACRIIYCLETPESGMLGTGRSAQAYLDSASALRRECTPVQMRRIIDGTRRWFLSTLWERAVMSRGALPTLNEYFPMRMACGAAPLWMCLAELDTHLEITDREMDAPAVRAATELSWLVSSLDNDLFSCGKELHREEDAINIVSVLRHHNGLHQADAIAQAAQLRDSLMLLFVQVCERISPSAGTNLRSYLTGLGQIIRGHLDWAISPRTHRYTDPDGEHPNSIQITASITDTPPAQLAPLTLPPSVAWWMSLPETADFASL